MFRLASILTILAMFILAAPNAGAGWSGCRLLDGDCVDYEIQDIFDRVNTANSRISHANQELDRHKKVIDKYRNQMDTWNSVTTEQVRLIKDGVLDVFGRLPPVSANYLKFVGNGSKCGVGSPCYEFQTQLIVFFQDLTDLNRKFPALERAGLQDKDRVSAAILKIPPIMLFGIHRTLESIPDWDMLPQDLAYIYDEIDDPEVFDMELRESDTDTNSSSLLNSSQSRTSAFRNTTKTQRFCKRRADKFDGMGRGPNGNRDGWDEIRLNRIVLVATLFTDIWKFGLDQVPDDLDIGASLVGEGGYLGIPSSLFTWMFKTVPLAMESILKAIDTYRTNIGICQTRFAQVEGRLASCGYFTEFVLDSVARDEYYGLVDRRLEMAEAASIDHTQSDSFLSKSHAKLDSEQYKQAFELLCDAYQSIGVNTGSKGKP